MTDRGMTARILGFAIVCTAFVTAASAAPMGPSHVSVDYSDSGMVIVDVFGGSGATGTNFGGSQWDPLMLTNINGTVENLLAFGGETSDTRDDFVRYWINTSFTSNQQRWIMPTASSALPLTTQQEQEPGLPVPEPGSLVLLGSGLIGLASSARRLSRRR